MRWLLLVLTVVALALCFTRHGGGAMAWWLFVSVIGAFATTLAFADARIASRSREQTLCEYQLRRLREGKEPFNHDNSTPKQ